MREKRLDVLLGTPQAVAELIRRGSIEASRIGMVVLDRTDVLLESGCLPFLLSIFGKIPSDRQTLLLSSLDSTPMEYVAARWTRDPLRVDVVGAAGKVPPVIEVAYIATTREKFGLLCRVLRSQSTRRALVFVNPRYAAARLARELARHGFRTRCVPEGREGKGAARVLRSEQNDDVRVWVATDWATRGLRMSGISDVINFDVPTEPEDYLHRMSFLARCPNGGRIVLFATEDDALYLPDIERFLGHTLRCLPPPEESPTANGEGTASEQSEATEKTVKEAVDEYCVPCDRENTPAGIKREGR